MRIAILLAMVSLLFSTVTAHASLTGSGSVPPAPPLVVKPGTQGTNGDVRVKNGLNPTEQNASRGNAIVKPGSGATDATSTEVKLESRFRGEVESIELGDSVVVQTNCTATVSGTGGTVSVGSGSTVTVTNTATGPMTPANTITITLNGGASALLGPGNTVTMQGG